MNTLKYEDFHKIVKTCALNSCENIKKIGGEELNIARNQCTLRLRLEDYFLTELRNTIESQFGLNIYGSCEAHGIELNIYMENIAFVEITNYENGSTEFKNLALRLNSIKTLLNVPGIIVRFNCNCTFEIFEIKLHNTM